MLGKVNIDSLKSTAFNYLLIRFEFVDQYISAVMWNNLSSFCSFVKI